MQKDYKTWLRKLIELINMVAEKQPVVLAGHTLVCQIVKYYTRLRPEKYAIIIIDPKYNPEL